MYVRLLELCAYNVQCAYINGHELSCFRPLTNIWFCIFIVIYGYTRNCSSDANSPADECQRQKEMLTTVNNYTYYSNYTIGNACCIELGHYVFGAFVPITVCACNTDNCNSNFPPSAGYTTTASYNMPTTSFASKPVDSLAIIISIIAVVSAIN